MDSLYIKQLRTESEKGLCDLCRKALENESIDVSHIQIAVAEQIEILDKQDYARFAPAALELVSLLESSEDADVSHVAAKILKSVRLAAFTHLVNEDAIYVDPGFQID